MLLKVALNIIKLNPILPAFSSIAIIWHVVSGCTLVLWYGCVIVFVAGLVVVVHL
jgi:hypothetical protein